jgi:hypothetical protein
MAWAFIGRPNVLTFEGAYHGNHDYSQVSVSPGAATNFPAGRADSAGVPEVLPSTVLITPYNDLETTRKIVEENRQNLACVIVEAVQRGIFSEPGFLSGFRKICNDNDVVLIFDEVVLIFDEVVTGFCLTYGGGQEYFGVTPDVAAYGKITGGGASLGAVARKAEVIDFADPARRGNGDYAQINGTLHGNPLASAARLARLMELQKPGFYDDLNVKADDLRKPASRFSTAITWKPLSAARNRSGKSCSSTSHPGITPTSGRRIWPPRRRLTLAACRRGFTCCPVSNGSFRPFILATIAKKRSAPSTPPAGGWPSTSFARRIVETSSVPLSCHFFRFVELKLDADAFDEFPGDPGRNFAVAFHVKLDKVIVFK